MRDITRKPDTLRTATAQTTVAIGPTGLSAIREGTLPKGEPFGICTAAGMLAAKKTSELIPHCHNLPIDSLEITCEPTATGVTITAQAKTVWKTGVEMEALTAVTVAALTLYDLLKMVEDDVVITETKLIEKKGGKSQFAALFRDVHPRFGVLVASDRASEGTYEDLSGVKITEILEGLGAEGQFYKICPDDQAVLTQQLIDWTKDGSVDFIFTTGGTGIAPRDVMVEATRSLIEREVPGIAEAMRGYSQRRKPLAMFSRGLVGIRGRTMIINLPGSTKGVEECLDALLPYLFHATGELAKGELPSTSPVAAPHDETPALPELVAAPPQSIPAPEPPPIPIPEPVAAEAPAIPRFDPQTGAPIGVASQPPSHMDLTPIGTAHLQPGWRGTVAMPSVPPTGQMPSIPKFDPQTGEPIGEGYTPGPIYDLGTPAPVPGSASAFNIPPPEPVAPISPPAPTKPDETAMFSIPPP